MAQGRYEGQSGFYRQKRAASLTGYGLIVGLIAIAAIAALQGVGTEVTSLFSAVGTQMQSASAGASGSGGSGSGGDETATGALIQPDNIQPMDQSIEIGETPTLQSSAFTVTGGSDTHIASQWQISATLFDFDPPLHDSGETGSALISYTVPAASLAGNSAHLWRVRHKGAALGWSDWSAPTSFHTLNFTHPCTDLTGIPPGTVCDDNTLFVGLLNAAGPWPDGPEIPIFTTPTDLSGTYQWKTVNTTSGLLTCSNEAQLVEQCFDGQSLTAQIIAASGTHPAATACNNLTFGIHSDWYLPSFQESLLMYDNLRQGEDPDQVFNFNISGSSTAGRYYMSSFGNLYPWSVRFSDRSLFTNNHTGSHSVRCVRR